jgi:hypothetical protein
MRLREGLLMSYNKKRTSESVASLAGKTLNSDNASNIQKILAAGALSQCVPTRQTGSQLEDIAAKALASSKYSDITKTLAGSVLAQANKKR